MFMEHFYFLLSIFYEQFSILYIFYISYFLMKSFIFFYKWKNHFYEMKGDVGMSLHEKEMNKKMPTPRHKVTHNPIPTSLFCFNMLFVCLFVMNVLGKANSTTS